MKINSNYSAWLSRLLTEDKTSEETQKKNQSSETAETAAELEAADRKETSSLMKTVQQELDKLEQTPDPQRAEKLQSLKDNIAAGNYQVDAQELASAMLDEIE